MRQSRRRIHTHTHTHAPIAVKIFTIISTSESPANNGTPVTISTMMAPMAHTSTGELYEGLCKSSSGARYLHVCSSNNSRQCDKERDAR